MLHASAVCFGARAIAFAGETGRGKSTLAASLHTARYTAIGDDGLVVKPGDSYSTAQPIYPGLRLWPESITAVSSNVLASEPVTNYSSKRRVAMMPQSDAKPMPLAAIYILAPPPLKNEIKDTTIAQLSSRDACIELMRNSFRLHLDYHNQISELLTRTEAVISQVPVFTLNYPRDYSCFTDVQDVIIEHSKRQIESIQKD